MTPAALSPRARSAALTPLLGWIGFRVDAGHVDVQRLGAVDYAYTAFHLAGQPAQTLVIYADPQPC